MLNWLMAVLLIVMFLFGMQIEELTLAERREVLPMHASMACCYCCWRGLAYSGAGAISRPHYPDSMSQSQQKWAKGLVYAFYLLMILVLIVGLLHAVSYMDFEIHAFGVWNLAALLPFGKTFIGCSMFSTALGSGC